MLISETEFDKNVNEMIFVEKMIFSVRFKKFIPQRCHICNQIYIIKKKCYNRTYVKYILKR